MVTLQLLLDLLKTQPQQRSPGAGGGSASDAVTELAADLLSRLQPQFDLELAETRFPLRYEESMNTVLKQVGGEGRTWSGQVGNRGLCRSWSLLWLYGSHTSPFGRHTFDLGGVGRTSIPRLRICPCLLSTSVQCLTD